MEDFQNNKLSLDELPQLNVLDFERLPGRYFRLRLWTWALVLFLSSFLLFGGILWANVKEDVLISEIPAVLWGLMTAWYLFISLWGISEFNGFALRGYAMRERDLSFRSGYFFHAYTTVPFNRLQHSEISQGPLERAVKLCTLKIYTAGSSGANLSISGMDPIDAQRIRDYIDEHGSE